MAQRDMASGGAPEGVPLLARLPNGAEVAPNVRGTRLFHGTDIPPEVALKELPGRGSSTDLLAHASGSPDSAFRGATRFASMPGDTPVGAAYWADEGGWVYEVDVPGWDVNALLEGRVPSGVGFAGNPFSGEAEIAIAARVRGEAIVRYAKVVRTTRGDLRPGEWIPNPSYKKQRR